MQQDFLPSFLHSFLPPSWSAFSTLALALPSWSSTTLWFISAALAVAAVALVLKANIANATAISFNVFFIRYLFKLFINLQLVAFPYLMTAQAIEATLIFTSGMLLKAV